MLTKKNKKMMGGSARAPNPYNVSMFNSHFVKLFNFYAKTHSNPDKPYDEPYVNISKSFTGEGIYIGFYDELHKITFGSVLDFAKTTTHTSFNHETLFYITITDKGNIIVNKFKLYIMSVIANYNMDGQKSLYDILKEPINKYTDDTTEIKGILSMKPVNAPPESVNAPPEPVNAPPEPVKALTPSQSDDDILELMIYREFGVKCANRGQCLKYDEKYGLLLESTTGIKNFDASKWYIFNIYNNIFEYISGTEGGTSSFIKIITSFDYIYNQSKKNEYYGFNTKKTFNIIKLLLKIKEIRKKVREIQGLTYRVKEDGISDEMEKLIKRIDPKYTIINS